MKTMHHDDIKKVDPDWVREKKMENHRYKSNLVQPEEKPDPKKFLRKTSSRN
jgi:hypothetical protein